MVKYKGHWPTYILGVIEFLVFNFFKFDYLRSKTVGAIDLPINKDTLYIVYTVEVCHEA